MSGAIGTQARWSINSASQGNVRLRRVKTYKIADGRSKEAVNAVGEDDPVGTTKKPGPRTITFDVYEEQGTTECDWRALAESGEFFSLTKQLINGQRWQYSNCQVSKVDNDGDAEGSHMLNVDILALTAAML